MNPDADLRRRMRTLSRRNGMEDAKVARGTLKRILYFAAPFHRQLVIFFALVVLTSVIGVLYPLIFREIINNGILGENTDLIVRLAFLLGFLAVLEAGFSLVQRLFSSKIGEGLIFSMRTKVFAHIQKMPVAFFTRAQTGSLVTRLNNDILGAQEAFTSVLSNVVGNLISVGLTIVAMLYLSWQLTLISLVILPVFVFPARWFGKKIAEITREGFDLNAEMNNMMIERFNVAGAMLTKLFGNRRLEDKSFSAKAGRVRDIGVTQAMYGRIFVVSLTLTASLATALIYGFGGVLAVEGALTVGTLIALTAYLSRLYGPLTSLSNIHVEVLTALVSFERVFEVLDLAPMIREKKNAVILKPGKATLEFKGVDFSYPTADEVSLASLESVATLEKIKSGKILDNVSFRVGAGEMVALVGHSGAGKTTILSLVARLYDARDGAVLVNGKNVKDVTLESLGARIGMVTQDSHMFHDTIKNNLLYAKPGATEKEMLKAMENAHLTKLISSLPQGLQTMVGERGYRLSGGEKQRLAIARVLLKSPDIVLLDEATSHLDSQSEAYIQEAFKKALAGRTSLVIAHRLSTVRNAEKILVLDKGRIVESGKHSELLRQNGVYAGLYKTQFANAK